MKKIIRTALYEKKFGTKVVQDNGKVFKRCSECREYILEKEFTANRKGKLGTHSRCPRCARNNSYRRKFGVGVDYFEFMLKAQNNRCALCPKVFESPGYGNSLDSKDKPVLDHDHITNIPRAVLCVKCNIALGIVEGDREWLLDALHYVKRHEQLGYQFDSWKQEFPGITRVAENLQL